MSRPPAAPAPAPAVAVSAMVEVRDVWKAYDHGRIPVLQGIDLTVSPGETIALCGASGSGKSTLLHIMGGLDSPDRGTVRVGGRAVGTAAERTALLRDTAGFVFQLHNLIADLTLLENCLVPALAAGRRPREVRDRIEQLLTATGIVHRLHRPVQELSGGERQRAALCRALVNRPRVLLADEPTGSLDETNGARILELLFELVARENLTLVFATHDPALAARCARCVHVRDGRLADDT